MFPRKIISLILVACFSLQSFEARISYAAPAVFLPAAGQPIRVSPARQPLLLKGVTIDPRHPMRFEFLIDKGDQENKPTNDQYQRLANYFLACIAIPEEDLWVNLSPYEKNRIIPDTLGQTALGRDLLAEDYVLKQLTASLIDPRSSTGKTFWEKVYKEAQAKYGTTQIPVNTFNKVWILADTARVHEKNNTVYVLDSHLKVMLEADYLSMQKHTVGAGFTPAQNRDGVKPSPMVNESQIIRQIVLPVLETEVNQGEHFETLRQIFHAFILANWYKNHLKKGMLNHYYSDKGKVNPLAITDTYEPQMIYQQYLQAYKKGVFNFIREEPSVNSAEHVITRRYFSGGAVVRSSQISKVDVSQLTAADKASISSVDVAATVDMKVEAKRPDNSMNASIGPARQAIEDTFKEWQEIKTGRMHEKDVKTSQAIASAMQEAIKQSPWYKEALGGKDSDPVIADFVHRIAGDAVRIAVSFDENYFIKTYGIFSHLKAWGEYLKAIREIRQGKGAIEGGKSSQAKAILDFYQEVVEHVAEGQAKQDIKKRQQMINTQQTPFQRLLLMELSYQYLKEELGEDIKEDLWSAAYHVGIRKQIVINVAEIMDYLADQWEGMRQESKAVREQLRKVVTSVAVKRSPDQLKQSIGEYGKRDIKWQSIKELGFSTDKTDQVLVQYLIAVYVPAMEGKAKQILPVLQAYEDKNISWKGILEIEGITPEQKVKLLEQYLIAVYMSAKEGQADQVAPTLKAYEDKDISWEGILELKDISPEQKVKLLEQYLVAVYQPAKEGQADQVVSVLQAYKDKGISWKEILGLADITPEQKVKLLEQYLIAVYMSAMEGQAQILPVLQAYEDKDISWKGIQKLEGISPEHKVKLLEQYLVAVYQPAMKGQANQAVYMPAMEGKADHVLPVLQAYEDKDISWKGILELAGITPEQKVKLLEQYLVAVYEPAMEGKADYVLPVLQAYEDKDISWKGILELAGITPEQKVKLLEQYLVAVYQPAKEGQANQVVPVLQAYEDKGISWKGILELAGTTPEQKVKLLEQYLVAVYMPGKEGKADHVLPVLQAYEDKDISWTGILGLVDISQEQNVKFLEQYLVAIYVPAMAGKAALLKDMLGVNPQYASLPLLEKLNLIRVLWIMCLLKDGLSQWKGFLESYLKLTTQGREEFIKTTSNRLDKVIGPRVNPGNRRSHRDESMNASVGPARQAIETTFSEWQEIKRGSLSTKNTEIIQAIETAMQDAIKQRAWYKEALGGKDAQPSDPVIADLAHRMAGDTVRIAVNLNESYFIKTYGRFSHLKAWEKYLKTLQEIRQGAIEGTKSSAHAQAILDFYQEVVEYVADGQAKQDIKKRQQMINTKQTPFQRLLLMELTYEYLKEELGEDIKEDLWSAAYQLGAGKQRVINVTEVTDYLADQWEGMRKENKAVREQLRKVVTSTAKQSAPDQLKQSIEAYKQKGITWQSIQALGFSVDQREQILVQYLIAVYAPAMEAQANQVLPVLQAYEDKGISWKGILELKDISPEQKVKLLEQYLVAVYQPAMKGQANQAVYMPAMEGKADHVLPVLQAYEDKDISWKGILELAGITPEQKVKLLEQYLVAVYQPAKEGQADQVVSVLQAYEDRGISWTEILELAGITPEQKVKLLEQYLVAVYQPAKEGQANQVVPVLQAYEDKGISWKGILELAGTTPEQKVKLLEQYLVAVYMPGKEGKADHVLPVLQAYEDKDISWTGILGLVDISQEQNVKFLEQYLVAVYQPAMAGKAALLKGMLEVNPQYDSLPLLEKLNLIRVLWIMCLLKDGLSQWKGFLESYLKLTTQDREEFIKTTLNRLDKVIGPRLNPVNQRLERDNSMNASVGPARQAIETTFSGWQEIKTGRIHAKYVETSKAIASAMQDEIKQRAWYREALGGRESRSSARNLAQRLAGDAVRIAASFDERTFIKTYGKFRHLKAWGKYLQTMREIRQDVIRKVNRKTQAKSILNFYQEMVDSIGDGQAKQNIDKRQQIINTKQTPFQRLLFTELLYQYLKEELGKDVKKDLWSGAYSVASNKKTIMNAIEVMDYLSKTVKNLKQESQSVRETLKRAVTTIAQGSALDQLKQSIEAYKQKGITWQSIKQRGLSKDEKDRILAEYLIAIYMPAKDAQAKHVLPVLQAYEDKGISWKGILELQGITPEQRTKLLQRYLIAVYAPAMEGQDKQVVSILQAYEAKGISWKKILEIRSIAQEKKAELLEQFLLAVYQPAMKGKASLLKDILDSNSQYASLPLLENMELIKVLWRMCLLDDGLSQWKDFLGRYLRSAEGREGLRTVVLTTVAGAVGPGLNANYRRAVGDHSMNASVGPGGIKLSKEDLKQVVEKDSPDQPSMEYMDPILISQFESPNFNGVYPVIVSVRELTAAP